MDARSRLWHGTHVLMATGMIDMSGPWSSQPVGAGLVETVFGVAAGAAVVLAVLPLTGPVRNPRASVPWVVAAVDLAAMAYMFAMASVGSVPVTVVLVGWFLLEAVAWGSGLLAAAVCPDPADAGACSGDPAVVAVADPDRTGAAADAACADGHTGPGTGAVPLGRGTLTATRLAPAPVLARTRAWSMRISLGVMALAMAYMLLVMQFGMPDISSVTPGGGMPGMPGMPGM